MKKTVQEGQELFYIEENQIYSGHAVEVMDTPQGQTFSIDTIGACEGLCVFSDTVIGNTVFFTREEAEKRWNKQEKGDQLCPNNTFFLI